MTDERRPNFEHVKVLPLEIEKAERTTDSGRPRLDISGMVSTVDEDHEGEIIEVGFFDKSLEPFLRRGTMRWMHQPGEVVGKWTKVEPVEGKGYHAEGYMVHLGSEEIDGRRFAMVEEGLVASASVGFNGKYDDHFGKAENGRWHWRENGTLMEISPVDIPANEGASIMVAKSLGLEWYKPQPPRTDETEEQEALEYLARLNGAVEWLRNTGRHWEKDGGALSANVLSALVSPLTVIPDVLRVGRVLSAANREKVEAAVSALQGVLDADSSSRKPADEDEEETKIGPDDWMRDFGVEVPAPVDFAAIMGAMGEDRNE